MFIAAPYVDLQAKELLERFYDKSEGGLNWQLMSWDFQML